MKENATQQEMRTAIELLLDMNPSMNNFAYNRSLTASPLCPCKETEETATHFHSTVQYTKLRTDPQKISTCTTYEIVVIWLNSYELADVLTNHNILILSSVN